MTAKRAKKIIDAVRSGRVLFKPDDCAVQRNVKVFIFGKKNLLDNEADIKYIIDKLES